jgi:hypothetical protein
MVSDGVVILVSVKLYEFKYVAATPGLRKRVTIARDTG